MAKTPSHSNEQGNLIIFSAPKSEGSVFHQDSFKSYGPKAVKVSNFHLDSPDWSISSPAVEVRPAENLSLLTAVD